MKTLYNSLLKIVMLFMCSSFLGVFPIFAQTPKYLVTPHGRQILDTYTCTEYDTTSRRGLDDSYKSIHPNAEMLYLWGEIYSSSGRYNCHGYAWHMFGDNAINDPVWLGYYNYGQVWN
jgi:hypothetical protein